MLQAQTQYQHLQLELQVLKTAHLIDNLQLHEKLQRLQLLIHQEHLRFLQVYHLLMFYLLQVVEVQVVDTQVAEVQVVLFTNQVIQSHQEHLLL